MYLLLYVLLGSTTIRGLQPTDLDHLWAYKEICQATNTKSYITGGLKLSLVNGPYPIPVVQRRTVSQSQTSNNRNGSRRWTILVYFYLPPALAPAFSLFQETPFNRIKAVTQASQQNQFEKCMNFHTGIRHAVISKQAIYSRTIKIWILHLEFGACRVIDKLGTRRNNITGRECTHNPCKTLHWISSCRGKIDWNTTQLSGAGCQYMLYCFRCRLLSLSC